MALQTKSNIRETHKDWIEVHQSALLGQLRDRDTRISLVLEAMDTLTTWIAFEEPNNWKTLMKGVAIATCVVLFVALVYLAVLLLPLGVQRVWLTTFVVMIIGLISLVPYVYYVRNQKQQFIGDVIVTGFHRAVSPMNLTRSELDEALHEAEAKGGMTSEVVAIVENNEMIRSKIYG